MPSPSNNKINDSNVELFGYSEQIMGEIMDMAPGIPNQDEFLK